MLVFRGVAKQIKQTKISWNFPSTLSVCFVIGWHQFQSLRRPADKHGKMEDTYSRQFRMARKVALTVPSFSILSNRIISYHVGVHHTTYVCAIWQQIWRWWRWWRWRWRWRWWWWWWWWWSSSSSSSSSQSHKPEKSHPGIQLLTTLHNKYPIINWSHVKVFVFALQCRTITTCFLLYYSAGSYICQGIIAPDKGGLIFFFRVIAREILPRLGFVWVFKGL